MVRIDLGNGVQLDLLELTSTHYRHSDKSLSGGWRVGTETQISIYEVGQVEHANRMVYNRSAPETMRAALYDAYRCLAETRGNLESRS